MADLVLARPAAGEAERELTQLVLDGVTSPHSRRAYATGVQVFFSWLRGRPQASFTKALVQEYRSWLLEQSLSPATINLRLSPLRKLAREMADNGMIDPGLAAGIGQTEGVKQQGVRAGNWLLREQANELLNAPAPETLKGLRDRALLALLIGCGLRRSEVRTLEVDQIQQREGRWVIPDLVGKGKRLRTVPVPPAVKVRVDHWLAAAEIREGRIFRPINKADRIGAEELQDDKAIWLVVLKYAQETSLGKLSPHDLRRTCAKLCRKSGGELEQIQLLLGHASVQTTERYLGTEQDLAMAVNDAIGLELN